MRNLSLNDFRSYSIQNIKSCQVFCYDHNCFYAYDKGIVIKKFESNEEVICDFSTNLYPVTEDNDSPTAVDISYCYEKETLIIILQNGDIVSLGLEGYDPGTIIGSVESGIKAAQWSPEKEVIAVITGNDTVIVMTNDFDPLSEVDLHGEGFGEKQFESVGWGRNETQFRGSEGKFSLSEKVKEVKTLPESNEIKISWRGDAEYFVVSCVNPKSSQRYLRIFSKAGVLQYTGESVSCLEHCLNWRPSGNLIASTQSLPNKYVVCFFEKNGLRHGELILPFKRNAIRVDEVLWNNDSKILALLITKLDTTEENNSSSKYIQLYTFSNYHWYCKYTINFETNSVPMLLKWNCQKYNTLHVVVKKGSQVCHNIYSWLWVTNKSKGNTSEDESFVAVIDGCNLLLTSFMRGIIPPPMFTYNLQLSLPINSVSFSSDAASSNDFILHMSDNSLLIYKFLGSNSKTVKHELLGKVVNFSEDVEFCYNVEWVSTQTLMLCAVKVDGNLQSFLRVIKIKEFTPKISYEKNDVPLNSTVAILRSFKSGIVLYSNDGKLYLCNSDSCDVKEMYTNDKKTLIELECKDKDDGTFYVFSLDNLNKFYINNHFMLPNVMSFHIHDQFVLLTTLKCELVCLDVENEIQSNQNLSDLYKRKVERGSRLVTSVNKDMKVILQMPRGNLECVQLRPLAIFTLGKYLNSLQYYEAFDLMRKQRINLNLLYDHNPDLFSRNVNVFIEQIKEISWINLFLSDLQNEDVTKTMYSVMYAKKTSNETNGVHSKIDTVCDLIEKVVTNKNSDKYLLPILTCYIKRNKTEFLEKALLKLKELKIDKADEINSTKLFDEAFKYVLYLIDVEELYKTALGMYDFDLVLIVASKSQKDPKEYLPFLNELKKLEPNYQKFSIDKYLKRYQKALQHLVLCDGDDIQNELINFIKAHKLYKFALKLIPKHTDHYKNVCISYGDELMESHKYEDAAIMYSTAGVYKNAIEAYRKSGNWQETIQAGIKLKLSEDDLNELYLDLAMELTDLKYFKEAATVYLDYLKDVEECVRVLSKGKLYSEAYRIAQLHQNEDLISLTIVPAVLENGNLMQTQIDSYKEIFIKQKNRLQIVRTQKLLQDENKTQYDGNDLISETNTVITQSNTGSRTTNRTYRSAKNRRKQERKLLSLKEGGQYEDLALIISLHKIVTNCYDLKMEVRELNKFLIKTNNLEIAEKIQNDFENLLQTIEHSKSEIWNAELLSNKQYYGPDATSNEIAAMYTKTENVWPSLFNPKFAIAPESSDNVKWQLEILKT